MNVKIRTIKNQLVALSLQGMIVSNPLNIYYLTGIKADGTLLIAPKENAFLTDSIVSFSVSVNPSFFSRSPIKASRQIFASTNSSPNFIKS